MSPLTALWVASVIGASLFFASGLLSAEVLQRIFGRKLELLPVTDVAADTERERLSSEADLRAAAFAATEEQLRGDATRAQEVARHVAQELDTARAELALERSARAALERELAGQRAHLEEANRRFTEAQKSASLVPPLKKRLEEVEHSQATRARAAAQSDEKTRGLERELARARDDIERLESQLAARVDTQTQSLVSDVKRLEEKQQERNLRVKMLEDRITELQSYAEENAALRGERDALRRDVERLRRAARDSLAPPSAPPRVQVDHAGVVTHISRAAQSGTRRVHDTDEHTLESSLKQHLARLMSREPGLIAVLSDDNGFPVAGVGTDQQQESVSVLTSLTQELAFRVKEFVDLERIERMELADGAGRALRVRFFDWETQPLALACLGKRSLVANPEEEIVVTAFPQLLRRAWSA